ncbi:MAG TPA: hypothetical protein PK252_08630 [Bacteroidales bacterium]|nr:hypothetical protein [Bacteroidales bacterium]
MFIYSDRNSSRMRDYHRLDLSLTIKDKGAPDRFWHGEWVFSVYNVYGRHNDWMINYQNKFEGTSSEVKEATRTYLPFLFFPGITYNFYF